VTQPDQPAPSLLLLIPAYNEEERIEPVLVEFAEFFQKHYKGKFQLVVVLNGCRDDTIGVVRRVGQRFPSVTAREFQDPIGKGGALIEGLKLAPLGDLIGYVDADGATGPAAFFKLVEMTGKADCVIGSRWLPGAVLHQSQTKLRRFASRCFHAVVQSLLWLNVKDTQCPAKVMSRAAVEKIHDSLLTADLAFDVNLLYSLKRAGFTILEVPIEWTDKMGSKVTQSLVRSSLTMFLSVVRLRLIYSRLYPWLRGPLGPIGAWLYKKLRAPKPLPGPKPPTKDESYKKDESQTPNSAAPNKDDSEDTKPGNQPPK
jgi:glycosyltransferase involved in cell wall biosynthesis